MAAKKNNSALLRRLQKVECPDTTFFAEKFPIVIKKGAGMVVCDEDHNRYLDFTACFAVLALGHRPKTTLHALRKQSALLLHGMGDVHPTQIKIKLLELLAKVSPYDNAKSLLGLSGGDAVEAAMKTSLLVTKRSRFLSFSGGYHGLQCAPLSLNHRAFFTAGFESFVHNQSTSIPFPYFSSDFSSSQKPLEASFLKKMQDLFPFNDVLQFLEEELKKKEYAALVMEPIQGRGGKRKFSAEFVKSCFYLCQKYGTLLVFDEVYTGFGRTGKMFALEHYGVVPDLLCVGKAMGGGLPLSACIGQVLDVWGKSSGESRHTQTFLGNPLACAAGYHTILEIKKRLPVFQKELVRIEIEFKKFIQKWCARGLAEKYPFEIRGMGFMRGIWFYGQKEGFCVPLVEKLLKKGFLVLPEGERGDVLALTPPLIATATHYRKILNEVISLFCSS